MLVTTSVPLKAPFGITLVPRTVYKTIVTMRTAVLCLFGASALGVLSGLKTRSLSAALGMPLDPGWLPFGLAAWYLVALPAPALVPFAERMRPDRVGWAASIATHLGIWLATWLFFTSSFAALRVTTVHTGVPFATMWVRDAFWALNWTLYTYSAIVAVVWSRAYRREAHEARMREEQLRARLADDQARALRARLEPHFVFNALHGVGALIHREPASARHMLVSLGELLQSVLKPGEDECATLRDELHLVRQYVSLQQLRFGERLAAKWHIDEGLDDARVPRLLLLTLVENAVGHAVGASRERTTVDIRARLDVCRVILEVRDDGPGLGMSPRRGLGIGLDHTRKRLNAMYGPDARLELIPRRRGVLVRVTVPARRGERR